VSFKFLERASARTIPIVPIETAVFDAWCKTQPKTMRDWVAGVGFKANAGEISFVAGAGGRLEQILLGVDAHDGLWAYAGLPSTLPAGSYRIDARMEPDRASAVALGWALGCYRYERYKADKTGEAPSLVWPAGADRGYVERAARATGLVRDLINTPAGDMGPAQLASAARAMARPHGAKVSVITGDALLKQNYPTIHAVGRAGAPRVSLVGKGVCFDTGGLDLKAATGMLRMKKDMGGGAHVLGLADMIMDAKLDVRLRVLVPAVENSVGGNA
jgi:leucyl aminopeptidase